jgi:hypothetical protein
MAKKSIGDMTSKEKQVIFGKKKRFVPLFDLPEVLEKIEKPKKVRKKKVKKETLSKKKKVKKQKKEKNIQIKEPVAKKVLHTKIIKYKTIEAKEAEEFIIKNYNIAIEKKTKKQKHQDESKIITLKPTGILLSLHEDSSKEIFHMIGKLVESKIVKRKAYVTDYYFYEIYK